MFSPIECPLRPSRLAWLVTWLPVPLLSVLAWLAARPPLWILLPALVVQFALWRIRPPNPPAQLLRWQHDRLSLFDADHQAERFRWNGLGRRSACYIRLQLETEAGAERSVLMLWRDSLSDASWRALNAYYRVIASQVRAEVEEP